MIENFLIYVHKFTYLYTLSEYTACARKYLLRRRRASNVRVNCELYEVMKMEDGPRSWFIDNTVQTGTTILYPTVAHYCTNVHLLAMCLMSSDYLMQTAHSTHAPG